MIFPTVHINGTSADVLLEEVLTALMAVSAAHAALCGCNPNGRDYPDGNIGVAVEAQASRLRRLSEVVSELEEMAEHISDQRK